MSQYKSRRRIVADNEPDDLDDVLPEDAPDDEGAPSEDIEDDAEGEEDDALDRVFKAKAAIAGAATLAERNRVIGLFGLVKQAARLGVDLDLRNAIERGVSLKQAKNEVLNTAAEQANARRPISTSCRPLDRDVSPRPTSGAKAKTVWKNAFKRD